MLGRIRELRKTIRTFLSINKIRFGSLRTIKPVDREFGFNLGTPIDRYYIESFLREHSKLIQGDVLEVGEDSYTSKYASGEHRLTVLNVVDKPGCLKGDLESGNGIPENTFDCVIMTQTLPFIYDLKSAVFHVHKMLKPGGHLLATNPCISQISRFDMDRWGDYWRFTPLSIRRLLEDHFAKDNIKIEAHGNSLTSTCFIQGIPCEKLSPRELDHADKDYPVTITALAKKPSVLNEKI
jgi:hypothetical protein